MNPQKEFKLVSIFLLLFGLLDVANIVVGYTGDGGLTEMLKLGGGGLLLAIFAVTVLIALAKLYMGIMGIMYCSGKGKGKLHITLAKVGMVLAIIAIVISVVDMISGSGTIVTVCVDVIDFIIIHWYFKISSKNYK